MSFGEELLLRLRPRSVVARYTLGVAAVGAALGLRLLLTPLTGRGAPFVIFFGATLLTSLLAGSGPAALCLALSLPIALRLFVLPEAYPVYQAVSQAALYAADGVIIIVLTALARRWQNRVEAANVTLQEASALRARALVRMRETIDLAPDAYFLSNLRSCFIDVNQAACRLLGYPWHELVGMSILDIIRAEDVSRLESEKSALLVPGTVLTNEWILKRRDGTLVPVEVSANILEDGRWQAFVRDITERQRITGELRESEERFRLTIEEAPIGMALVALDGRFERVNQMLCEITGYSAEELVRLTVNELTHPDDLAKDVELARQLATGDIPRYQLEKRYIRKDGSIVIILLSVSILRGPASEARYYIERVEDITARKRADEALRVSEAKFSGIVSIAADAIISVDEQQRITIFNAGAERIFGYSRDDVLGTPLERLIPERFREAHRRHFARFVAGQENSRRMGERQDIFGLRKNGEEFPAEASISRVGVDGVKVLSVVLRDISYRKSVEEALRRAVAARDDVLGVVVHDLRNPLGTILMQASLLERSGPDPERRDPKPREMIVRSAKRMNRMIQDLLDVSLADSAQLKVMRTRVSTMELIREAVEAQVALAAASKLSLRLEVADDVPDISGDYDRLLQVFENLIGNAIKFTPAGGRIAVSALALGDDVRFSVADTGAGLAPEGLAHIFDRFWQGNTNARRLGAGLGLPITRGLVVAHGGKIWAESALGQGTTLFFTIPRAPAKENRPLEPKHATGRARHRLER